MHALITKNLQDAEVSRAELENQALGEMRGKDTP